MRFDNVTIKGVGAYLPARVITNQEIERTVDTTAEWVYNKLGIRERRVVTEEQTSDLGYYAALRALEDANLNKEDLDMIIVATSSPEKISPSIACTVHNKLKISKNVIAFDVNAVCSGFIYALSIGSSFINSQNCSNVLVVATEAYSRVTNWEDRHCVFFGDGAGAVILSSSQKGWIHSELQSNGRETGMTGFNLPLDKPFIMKGKEVWNQAVQVLPESIRQILQTTKLTPEDIKMLIPHQPSIHILKIIAQEVGLPFEKVKTVMDRYANIAGASIPIALEEAIRQKEIEHGDKILLTAIGSGWTWGSILLNYEK